MATFQDILIYLLIKYRECYDKSPTKTKLLKLAYLGELSYFRSHRRRLTGVDWIYYLFGPWTKEYDRVLFQGPFELEQGSDPDIEARFVRLMHGVEEPHFGFEEKIAITGVVSDFGAWDLNKILDYVYFETEPMMEVEERGDRIDFSVAKPAEFYKRREISVDKKVLEKIRKKYKAKLSDAKEL